jgi:hypothetical protein
VKFIKSYSVIGLIYISLYRNKIWHRICNSSKYSKMYSCLSNGCCMNSIRSCDMLYKLETEMLPEDRNSWKQDPGRNINLVGV